MRNRVSYSLKKPKVRASWNKYNLFNLSRVRHPYSAPRTHFQQKWTAKSMARAYHGEMVREKQWERMFSRRSRAVVPMDAKYLAENDGSMESAGRGGGLAQLDRDGNPVLGPKLTPYMQMTFAPLERRLDMAIFRAMFASSARQARQFVVHGAVKVNGKKMRYPGYLLNPADMFQVEPERVMYATGAPKDSKERRAGRLRKRLSPKAEAAEKKAEEEARAKEEEEEEEAKTEAESESKAPEDPRETLKNLLAQAKGMLSSGRDTLPAKRKQALRGFQANVRRLLSRAGSSAVLTGNMEAQLEQLRETLNTSLKSTQQDQSGSSRPSLSLPSSIEANQQTTTDSQQYEQSTTEFQPSEPPPPSVFAMQAQEAVDPLAEEFAKASLNPDAPLPSHLSDEDTSILRKALQQLRDNPIDSSKPYATPWRPRDYMSAFAFVPPYLEVNHNICAAVYLRHPVARPGKSEVPSPYGEPIGGAAFAWYLRRR